MTPAGHSLMGMSIGVLCVPGRWGAWAKAGALAAFAVLANAPDLVDHVSPQWYATCHPITHSVFVNAAAIIALGLIAWPAVARRAGRPWLVIGGQAAWASHLLLDATYNHGDGVHAFWPVSNAALVLTLPWFSTFKFPWSDHAAENVRTIIVELLFYGGILLACVCVGRARRRHLARSA
ncbi:MAG: metal-dependent hydrolase [Planctomycetota bacterium]|jgi:membrane-bound metal-dependent hydrolase YbcI (DUF457 family)